MSAENGHNFRKIARRAGLAAGGVIAAGAIGGAAIRQMRVHASESGSAISSFVRDRFGNERAVQLEGILFAYDDTINGIVSQGEQMLTGILGEELPKQEKKPISHTITKSIDKSIEASDASSLSKAPEQTRPPLFFPDIKPTHENLQPGEGYWTTEGLPNPSPDDIVIAETIVHPDVDRPKATVKVFLIDKQRIDLHMTGGIKSPGADLGIVGPGKIPEKDLPKLFAAWNGGFQGTHAPDYGMYADGQEYRPFNDGLASLVIFKDGTVKIGQWGRDFTQRTENMVAVRQNTVLLVDDGVISPIINESVTFGLVNIGDTTNFITWRSAIGLTEKGDLLVAAGNQLNQVNMARAMQAVGAKYAMLLDNNLPYVQTVLAYQQPDGSSKLMNTMDFMSADPNRYTNGGYLYDFMWATKK